MTRSTGAGAEERVQQNPAESLERHRGAEQAQRESRESDRVLVVEKQTEQEIRKHQTHQRPAADQHHGEPAHIPPPGERRRRGLPCRGPGRPAMPPRIRTRHPGRMATSRSWTSTFDAASSGVPMRPMIQKKAVIPAAKKKLCSPAGIESFNIDVIVDRSTKLRRKPSALGVPQREPDVDGGPDVGRDGGADPGTGGAQSGQTRDARRSAPS